MSLPGRHILYVDDHEDTCDLVSCWLRIQGLQMTAAGSLAEGLRLAESARFDLYLLDERLPHGSGEELCRKLREFDSVTPIVFHSADAAEAGRERLLKLGAQAFVPKPVEPEELIRTITELLGKDAGH
ncbi:MAG TPA: response regulator [Blastocatellia bacterium]|nr:response regulator [Blastocatellia bacterium]